MYVPFSVSLNVDLTVVNAELGDYITPFNPLEVSLYNMQTFSRFGTDKQCVRILTSPMIIDLRLRAFVRLLASFSAVYSSLTSLCV